MVVWIFYDLLKNVESKMCYVRGWCAFQLDEPWQYGYFQKWLSKLSMKSTYPHFIVFSNIIIFHEFGCGNQCFNRFTWIFFILTCFLFHLLSFFLLVPIQMFSSTYPRNYLKTCQSFGKHFLMRWKHITSELIFIKKVDVYLVSYM